MTLVVAKRLTERRLKMTTTARISAVAIFCSFAVGAIHAQSMPLVAKFRSTGQIIVDGKVVETHVREGFFYRSSNGSEVRRPMTFDGKPLKGGMARASLFDAAHGVNYRVDYDAKEAFRDSTPPLLGLIPPTPPHSATKPPSGESSVDGYPCSIRPVYAVKPSGTSLIGSNCVSEEYGVILKTDVTRPSDLVKGKAAHEITELYDIQIGVDPDPKLFDLGSLKVISSSQ
jgi:hypothetical protein